MAVWISSEIHNSTAIFPAWRFLLAKTTDAFAILFGWGLESA